MNKSKSKLKPTYTSAYVDLPADATYEYYLVFDKDTGNREDCNVYYSNLVFARSVKEAIEILALKHATNTKEFQCYVDRCEAKRMELIVSNPEDAFIDDSNGKRKHFLQIYN